MQERGARLSPQVVQKGCVRFAQGAGETAVRCQLSIYRGGFSSTKRFGGKRALKIDGAFAPKVLRFDSG